MRGRKAGGRAAVPRALHIPSGFFFLARSPVPALPAPLHKKRRTDSSIDRRTRRNWRSLRVGSPATESSSPVVASSSSNRPAVICLSSSSATARSRCAGGRVRGTPGLNRADARTAAGTESPHEHSSYARPVCQSCGGGEGVNAGPGWAAGRGGHARDRRWRGARGAKHVSKKKSARPLVLARSRPPNPPRPRPPGPGRLGCSFDRPLGGGQAGLGCGDGHRGRGEAGRGAGDGRPGAPLCLPFFLRPPRRRAPPARAPPPLQLAPMGKLAPSVMASERDTAQLRHTRSRARAGKTQKGRGSRQKNGMKAKRAAYLPASACFFSCVPPVNRSLLSLPLSPWGSEGGAGPRARRVGHA